MSKSGSTNTKLLATLAVLHGSFFVSGLCCLIYEIVWQRVSLRLLGATVPATVAILCAFMIGMSIGALIAGRNLSKLSRPLTCYAVLELGIGFCGLASAILSKSESVSWLSDSIAVAFGHSFALALVLKGIALFALLLVPTALMGATLPVLAHFSSSLRKELSASALTTSLYATNTSGAVAGTLAAGFFLLPSIGIAQTLVAGSLLNFLSGVLALICARNLERTPAPDKGTKKSAKAKAKDKVKNRDTHTDKDENRDRTDRAVGAPQDMFPTFTLKLAAVLVFVSSTLSIVMQVIWTRFFVLNFGSSTYAFSTVTATFILGLAIGAFNAPRIARSIRRLGMDDGAAPALCVVAAACGLAVATNLFQFQSAPALFLSLLISLSNNVSGIIFYPIVTYTVAIWLVLLPATIIGAMFPLAIATAIDEDSEHETSTNEGSDTKQKEPAAAFGEMTARLYALSILGCVFGSICGGILFSSFLGVGRYFDSIISTTTAVVALIYALVAVAATSKLAGSVIGATKRELIAVAVLVVATTVAIVAKPGWDKALMVGGANFITPPELRKNDVPTMIEKIALRGSDTGDRILMYAEGENATVSVGTSPSANLNYLKSNSKVEAAIPIDPFFPAVRGDLPTQTLLGLLPAILHTPEKEPLKVAAIGFGSGTTCGALARVPWIEKITALEIEPAIVAAEHFFDPGNYSPLKPTDGKVKVQPINTDARSYLATTPEKFDIIVSQPAEPWVSGASDLYTKEFYSLSSRKLEEHGIYCQWVQLYSISHFEFATILRTFQSEFPYTTIWRPARAGEVLLIGAASRLELDPGAIEARLRNPSISPLLQRIGIHDTWEFLATSIANTDQVKTFLKECYQLDKKLSAVTNRMNTDDNLALEFSLANHIPANPDTRSQPGIVLTPGNLKRSLQADQVLAHFSRNKSPEEIAFNLGLAYRSPRERDAATDFRYLKMLSPQLQSLREPSSNRDIYELSDRLGKVLLATRQTSNYSNEEKIHKAALESDFSSASVQLADQFPPDIKYGADLLDDLGTIYLNSKNAEKAIQCFSLAATSPNRSRSLSGLALARWLAGDFSDKNIAVLEQSLALDPNQYVARIALSQSLIRKELYEKALPHLRAAAQVYGDSPLPWELVANVAFRQKNWAMANQNLQRIRELFELTPEALAIEYLVATEQKQSARLKEVSQSFNKLTGKTLTKDQAEELLARQLNPPS